VSRTALRGSIEEAAVKQRLQKILSGAGVASRRAAEKLIEEGRVQVDGEVVRELGSTADPDSQDIRVDGARVRPGRARRTVVLNKPKGYVTTRSDPGRRPTVMELVPQALRSLFPVGRLDMASTGLLVLTDDGELAYKLTHPRFGIEKSYLVTVAGRPDGKVLDRAKRGIVVDGERLALDEVEIFSSRPERAVPDADAKNVKTRLRATLRRGKNREIRRIFGVLGHPVIDLHRERVGSLTLRGIPPGGYRPLSRSELELLTRPVTGSRPVGASPGKRQRSRPARRPRKSRS
jgi:23S rRNA pseudouridine2605 synthase